MAFAVVSSALTGAEASPKTVWDPKDVRVNDPSATYGPDLGWREPQVAIDPTNPKVMAAAVVNRNTVNAYKDAGFSEGIETYRSTDGGKKWKRTSVIHHPADDRRRAWTSGDTALVFDAKGTLYLSTNSSVIEHTGGPLGVYRSPYGGLEVRRSIDGGRTWSKPVQAVPRHVDIEHGRCWAPDRDLLGVHPRTGELFVAYPLFYNDCPMDQLAAYGELAAEGNKVEVMLVRSRNGGRTWSKPRKLWDGYAVGAQPAVGPDGTIYVSFTANVPLSPDSPCASIGSLVEHEASGLDLVVASSSDDGKSWRYEHRPMCEGEQHPSTGPRLWTRFPSISVDPSDGRAYVVWSSFASNPSFGLEVITSKDGGRTWSPTTHVTPFGITDSLQPWVSAERGVARVAWYATPDLGGTFDVFLSQSTDGGFVWSEPQRVSIISSATGDGVEFGDYLSMDVARGKVAVMWTDRRNADGATTIYARTADFN